LITRDAAEVIDGHRPDIRRELRFFHTPPCIRRPR